MNLLKKKKLAARTFGVGINRVLFIDSRKNEIKEAITKQDMRDLRNSGAIIVKEIMGRRKNVPGKSRGFGKIRMKVNRRKEKYVSLTRKLRRYLSTMKKEGKISKDEYKSLRNLIKNSFFKSKSHLKSHMESAREK
jgi:large subunit ribosomal protein L19e